MSERNQPTPDFQYEDGVYVHRGKTEAAADFMDVRSGDGQLITRIFFDAKWTNANAPVNKEE